MVGSELSAPPMEHLDDRALAQCTRRAVNSCNERAAWMRFSRMGSNLKRFPEELGSKFKEFTCNNVSGVRVASRSEFRNHSDTLYGVAALCINI